MACWSVSILILVWLKTQKYIRVALIHANYFWLVLPAVYSRRRGPFAQRGFFGVYTICWGPPHSQRSQRDEIKIFVLLIFRSLKSRIFLYIYIRMFFSLCVCVFFLRTHLSPGGIRWPFIYGQLISINWALRYFSNGYICSGRPHRIRVISRPLCVENQSYCWTTRNYR